MNKADVIREIVKLSKRTDYILSTDWNSYCKYSYNTDKLDYVTVEYGVYVDTGGSWLKYYTKDCAKRYELNPVETLLVRNLFM